jgi:para-aminobenzoate synthetase component I
VVVVAPSSPVRVLRAPGAPPAWAGPRTEVDRWEWREGDAGDPVALLGEFLGEHDLLGEPAAQAGDTVVALLLGAVGCARVGRVPAGRPSPVPAVPELAAVAYRLGGRPPGPSPLAGGAGHWTPSWSDAEHAVAVERVRTAIARGDVYQANVVGHRSAPHADRPDALAAAVARLPGATYGGVLAGDGWAVGCASPEQLVRVVGDRVTTVPVKGTLPVAPGSDAALRASLKDRAEHVMIVDLERNDLARIAVTGSVEVEQLYALTDWSGLWQAGSTVAARLQPGAGTLDVLHALLPGGSVTGAPKHAACSLLAELEPVGRGPSMGALGLLWPGGLDLGLTIRTVGVDDDRVHLWAGGGITWSSEPAAEVAEAAAKAAPVLAVLRSPASPVIG